MNVGVLLLKEDPVIISIAQLIAYGEIMVAGLCAPKLVEEEKKTRYRSKLTRASSGGNECKGLASETESCNTDA